jgi:quercetin dioxygenase-like cupin family protein
MVLGRSINTGWGELAWLVGAEEMPGAEQTFGVVTIYQGQSNPLHMHPNCEEVLYVISGECDHRLGKVTYRLTSGMLIRIPRRVPHNARCVSLDPLVAVVAFSSPNRLVENLEDEGIA